MLVSQQMMCLLKTALQRLIGTEGFFLSLSSKKIKYSPPILKVEKNNLILSKAVTFSVTKISKH
jgi:hypothetical protein